MARAAKQSGRLGTSSQAATAAPVTDEAYLAALGRRVRTTREQRTMSRRQLAEVAAVSERYLAQLEAGAGNASITFLRRVAAALGVRVTQLLDEEQSAQRHVIARLLDSLPEQKLAQVLQHLIRDFGTEASVRRRRITLIGLRGAGKSTLGSALADELRRPFVELDREIEQEAGMALPEIFMLYGQPGYRGFERRCLERIINDQGELVLSVGGGIVSEPETFHLLLANCYTVWIKASPAEHMSRVVAQGDMRPMRGHSQAMDDLKRLLASREALYARADAAVNTSGQSIEKSLAALRRAVAVPSVEPRRE